MIAANFKDWEKNFFLALIITILLHIKMCAITRQFIFDRNNGL